MGVESNLGQIVARFEGYWPLERNEKWQVPVTILLAVMFVGIGQEKLQPAS